MHNAALLHARTLREEAQKNFDQAVALVAQLRYDEAADKLSPLPEAFDAAGDPARAAEALFWLGYCHEKQGRTDRAASLYQNVIRSFPATPAARQAADRLSRLSSSTSPSRTPSPPQ
jgi:TolA-binding protein